MPRDAAATRTRIMDAAEGVVMRRGFAATSVDAIQEAADISRGTFFYHFPKKDDLSKALIRRYAENDAELIDHYMERAEQLASDPLQQALVFLALHEDLFEDAGPEGPGCLFASYSYEAGLFDEETRELVLESIENSRRALGDKFAAALERHSAPEGTDPLLLADMAYGMLQGAFILGRVEGDPSLTARHIKQFRVFLEALFGVG